VGLSTGNFKILFLQGGAVPQLGIMILSGVLKEHGFSTDVLSLDIENDNILENILELTPEVVACSVMTPEFYQFKDVLASVKRRRPETFVVVGGAHPTFFPDIIFTEDSIDAICIGEGEYALLELVTSLRKRVLDVNIKNLWVKQNGKIIKNEVRDLIQDLDSLPYHDRDVFSKRYPSRGKGIAKVMMSRGCPYNCSYCYNKGMREIYSGKGSWLRHYSSERVIEELKDVKRKYPLKWVAFMDDTFNSNKKRLNEFLKLYKKEVDIPFICQLRVDAADEGQIELLKQSGIERISIGIEHGDEEYRKRVLYKKVTNKQLCKFGEWVKKRKIRLFTFNILGFPDETLDMVFSTIEINSKMQPELAVTNFLTPYPGTDIYEYAKNLDALSDDFDFSKFEGNNDPDYNSKGRLNKIEIKNPNMQKIVSLRCFFMLLVWYPWLKPFVKLLIYVPHNPIYEIIWRITGTYRIYWKYAEGAEKREYFKRMFLLK